MISAGILHKQRGVARMRVSRGCGQVWSDEITYAIDDPLARFPSHERWLAIDGDPYQDSVRLATADLA